MTQFLTTWYEQWKGLLCERPFRISLMVGIIIALSANIANYYASVFSASKEVLSASDIILDYLPTIDLSYFYVFGMYFIELVVVVYPLFFRPELAPFTAKMVGAFFIIRSFFIILTDLGAPINFYNLPQLDHDWEMNRYLYLNDLFFSGHTGFPYLGALLFWENKKLRYLLLGMSFAMAVTVLLMHVHYSIDVFSAYFITYSIYKVSDKVFNELNLKFRKIVERIRQQMLVRMIRVKARVKVRINELPRLPKFPL